MSNVNSLGLDGILEEFYKKNIDWIVYELLDIYEYFFQERYTWGRYQ